MSIKVLIVDDSALIRQLLTEVINTQPDMRVVGVASDPLIAREKIKVLNPDVMTLDVEMPRMDGLAFLEKLMQLRPMPVVMISSLTERNADITLRALELGAVDFVTKPKFDIAAGIQEYSAFIAEKIRAAATAKIRPAVFAGNLYQHTSVPALANPIASKERLIALGASTGGTQAIREILVKMPNDAPAIVVTQHMPEGFTRPFAERINGLAEITVKEAEDGELIRPGHAYIAPGHSHLSVRSAGQYYRAHLEQTEPVNRHRPAVDVLFRSVAKAAGRNAIGVILTGMGADGAAGMLEMKKAGAFNIAQDEASCVVFGMPKIAIEKGAVHKVAPLSDIAALILAQFTGAKREAAR